MKNGVFCTAKISDDSMLSSVKMIRYISEVLGLKMYGDVDVEEVDGTLIYCAGPNAWNHKATHALMKAMIKCHTLVFVENDYAITRPRMIGHANDDFGSAWWKRAKTGRPPAIFWSTVKSTLGQRAHHPQSYVNWNALTMIYTFEPMARKKASNDLLYYGSYRPNRRLAFERYLVNAEVPITIAARKKSADQFEALYDDGVPGNVTIMNAIPEIGFLDELTKHGIGLYVEDERSHWEFHSPANRFYEMLSAGLPMVFQPESVKMLGEADLDVTPFVVKDAAALTKAMRDRFKLAEQQQRQWRDCTRFDLDLKKQLKAAWKALPGGTTK